MSKDKHIYKSRETDIAKAIAELVRLNIIPSKKKLIQLVGGSFSSKWLNDGFEKIQKLTFNFQDLEPLYKTYNIERPNTTPKTLKEDNLELFNKVERLEKYIQTLELDNSNLTQENTILRSENKIIEESLSLIRSERKAIINEVKTDKDLQITQLLEELSKTHQHYQHELSGMATRHDDEVIMAKVEAVNLKDKVNAQAKKIRAQDGELLNAKMTIKKLEGDIS